MKLTRIALLIIAIQTAVVTASEPRVSFNRDIRPILSNNCFHCHGPDATHREAGLRLDLSQADGDSTGGASVISPGDPDASELWNRVVSSDTAIVMPPADSGKELSAEDRDKLKRWIEQGGEYEGHWAFIPPSRPIPPHVDDERFSTNAIDRFVYRKASERGLTPAAPASKEMLLRRVTFDLTGLPPTLAEIDAFLADQSPDAYEKVVDRLLNSPHFGERMAVDWLDAARYGDTSVFHADGPRDMWVWRDWVVDALNRNLPYDQFTIQQMAGDLLPDAGWREKIATGFHRNNATTDEGGAIAEEFRVEYAVDRVKTTSMVWLGLSLECAQCHEHKYDPITQEDYYRFFAFFNQAADPGMQTRNGNQTPLVDVPDEMDAEKLPQVEQRLSIARKELDSIVATSQEPFNGWLATTTATGPTAVTPANQVAHLPMNTVAEGVINGASPADLSGVLVGEAKLVDGKFAKAVSTAANAYATFANAGDFERDQAFSYSVWFRPETSSSGAPLAKMKVEDGHRGYDLLLTGNEIEVHVIHSWPDNAIKVEAATEIAVGQWNHACVTYDGTSKAAGISIFFNGKKLTANIVNDSLSESIRTDQPLTVGRRSTSGEFQGQVDEVRLFERQLSEEEVSQLYVLSELDQLLAIPVDQRDEATLAALQQHFLTTAYAPYQQATANIAGLEGELAELRKPLSSVMVLDDVDQPRMTFVLKRGQYDAPDEQRPVQPGVPTVLPQLPTGETANRLDLAHWMVSKENPLTARVAVNRFWRQLFGTGIVKTVEEFGSQGEWPSHPELLDWLATDFMDHGWDMKRTIRLLVTSETYRQDSRVSAQGLKVDPDNRLLARGPRFRLTAEMVRDQALAVSGLLVPTIGGPSVKPFQPPGLWSEVSLDPGVRFQADTGASLYRRSLYTYWKRSAPPPMMLIFDAPTREKCTMVRGVTNTPLQALVLMNDLQFLEAARHLGERLQSTADHDEARLRAGYRSVTGREPDEFVLEVLSKQLQSSRSKYASDLDAANKLLAAAKSGSPAVENASEHAAWMIVAAVLLNLDECLTRG